MEALIDGDIVTYSSGFAAQHTHYHVVPKGMEREALIASFPYKKEAVEWVAGQEDLEIIPFIEIEPQSHALNIVKNLIMKCMEATKADSYSAYLSPSHTFRHDIATIKPYKGNRDPNAKPYWYKEIKEYMIKYHGAMTTDKVEADDILGVKQCGELLTHAGEIHPYVSDLDATVICTIDKDLDMVPGWHYNWSKDEKYFITPEQALYNFYMQLLTGDPTDNIQGVKGLGKAKAAKILADCNDPDCMFEVSLQAYEGNYRDMEENGRLLWIARELGPNGLPIFNPEGWKYAEV